MVRDVSLEDHFDSLDPKEAQRRRVVMALSDGDVRDSVPSQFELVPVYGVVHSIGRDVYGLANHLSIGPGCENPGFKAYVVSHAIGLVLGAAATISYVLS